MLWSTRADLSAKIVAPNESPRESEVPRLLSRRRGLGHSCDGAPGFSCLDDRLATPYFSRKPSGKALDLAASVAVLQDASRPTPTRSPAMPRRSPHSLRTHRSTSRHSKQVQSRSSESLRSPRPAPSYPLLQPSSRSRWQRMRWGPDRSFTPNPVPSYACTYLGCLTLSVESSPQKNLLLTAPSRLMAVGQDTGACDQGRDALECPHPASACHFRGVDPRRDRS